jgi:hypothetical protein
VESYYSTDEDGLGAFVGCAITGVDEYFERAFIVHGLGAFVGCAITGVDEYFERAFIVHGTDGSGSSCGLLK